MTSAQTEWEPGEPLCEPGSHVRDLIELVDDGANRIDHWFSLAQIQQRKKGAGPWVDTVVCIDCLVSWDPRKDGSRCWCCGKEVANPQYLEGSSI